MAEPMDSFTPEDFARFLNWEGWLKQDEAEAIAQEPDLTAAIEAARRQGVPLEQIPMFVRIQARAAEERQESPIVPGEVEPIAGPGPTAPPAPVTFGDAVTEVIQTGQDIFAQIQATADMTDEEDEVGFSALLFPGGITGINDARHIEMVSSDDYSPFFQRSREQAAIEGTHGLTVEARETGRRGLGSLDYWRNQYLQPGGYLSGQEILTWSTLSTQSRARLEKGMVNAGLLDPDGGYVPGSMGMPQLEAMRAAMSVGNYMGVGYEIALQRMGQDYAAFQRAEAVRAARARASSGGGRASFSVPAQLRQIPDYESLAQESTNMFRQVMGRDLEDYETEILADTLKGKYRERNAEMIKAARAAFYAAQGGGQGVMEVEVPDPQLRLQRFIEDRYEPELERQERVEETAVTNRLLIDAITKGTQMVGG